MQPHEFWQKVEPAGDFSPPFHGFYPARFDDGSLLRLPIRPLADGRHGLASLIINQASFTVLDEIADDLAGKLAVFRPDIIVGLPTLGLTLAAAVARKYGHARYVPLGTSRKFWYDEALSVPLSSVTTPDQAKRLYIDPRMLELLLAKRVVLVDDVISSGASMAAGIALLAARGVTPVALGTAMLQTERWRVHLADWPAPVVHVFTSPYLTKSPAGGWAASTENQSSMTDHERNLS